MRPVSLQSGVSSLHMTKASSDIHPLLLGISVLFLPQHTAKKQVVAGALYVKVIFEFEMVCQLLQITYDFLMSCSSLTRRLV